jgi:hypothetical protein
MDVVLDRPSATVLRQDAGFWALYDSAFPQSEREPPRVIIESVERGVALAVRARKGNETIGLATTHLLKKPAVSFLVYLAVSKAHRNCGLGPILVEEVTRGGPAELVWEVDAPDRASCPEERILRERRIAFFERLGGEVLLSSYRQPPVNGDDAVPMLLMGRGFVGTSEKLEALVRAIYFEKYAAANGIDRALLERLVEQSLGSA